MELTREEAIRLHRELWGWLAENPIKNKSAWPEWNKYVCFGKMGNETPNSLCFGCEYVLQQTKFKKRDCQLCPLDWPNENCKGNGLWGQWDNATAPEKRSRLAAIIRDLPEKKKEVKPAPLFSIGDKVVPVSKSVGDSFEKWTKWRKRDYITVDQLPPNEHGDFYICNNDYFLESDLRPYVEPKKKVEEVKPKSQFKVGDRVRVRADLVIESEEKSGIIFAKGMDLYKSKEATITEIKKVSSCGEIFYRLSIDPKNYSWTDRMLEPIKDTPVNQCPEPYKQTTLTSFKASGNKTTCTIEIDGRKFKGCAKCDPKDEWDEKTGKNWAELRATRKVLDAVEKELRRG